jgi:heme O synthase-like polyprenyltransferase
MEPLKSKKDCSSWNSPFLCAEMYFGYRFDYRKAAIPVKSVEASIANSMTYMMILRVFLLPKCHSPFEIAYRSSYYTTSE